MAIDKVQSLEAVVATSTAAARFRTVLVGSFGTIAMVLAAPRDSTRSKRCERRT